MQRLNPTVLAILAGLAVLLVLVVVFAGGGRENTDKLSDDQVAGRTVSDPEERCGSQATYDLIKRELFRRAGEVRGSDQAAFGRLAAYSVVRMDAPMLRSHNEEIGAIQCSGSIALDLPPGVAVVGGRRTLLANIGYAIQPAADGSGDVLTISNAEAIITPLATLARVGAAEAGDPLAEAGPTDPNLPPLTAPDPAPSTAPPPAASPPPAAAEPATTASPSFNCRNARTRGEIAVCGNPGLAGLDRQMAAQFNSALSRADPEERALLQRTRSRFLSYRDSCRSEACIADSYRGRMREIGDIMAGRWQAPR